MNNTTNKFRVIILMILVVLSVFSFTGCSKKSFSVHTDVTSAGIIMEFDNDTGSELSIGWTNGEIVINTDSGVYTQKSGLGFRIPRGTSQIVFEADSYKGKVESIEIPEISCLSDRNLPNEKLKNIVVYDSSENIESYSGNFSFFSSNMGKVVLFGCIGFGMVLIVLIVVVVIGVRANKKNKQAMQQFSPFGFQGNGAGSEMGQQMVMDAHFRAVSDQQSMINHQAMTDANNAASMGFTPPPTPPTPPTPPMGF